MRYLILASPRSGSTLLGRLLHATGKAGDPLEYFNPHFLEEERVRLGVSDLSFLGLLELAGQERSSPNGVFGMHLHLSQFADVFQSTIRLTPEMKTFLRSFDKFVWVRRRDRVRQAVSWAIARRTLAFTSKHKGRPFDERLIRDIDLVDSLKVVCANDHSWDVILKEAQLPHKMVWYEDLIGDYRGVTRQVLVYLGLSEEVVELPTPPIEKQATDLNERLRRRLIEYVGFLPDRS